MISTVNPIASLLPVYLNKEDQFRFRENAGAPDGAVDVTKGLMFQVFLPGDTNLTGISASVYDINDTVVQDITSRLRLFSSVNGYWFIFNVPDYFPGQENIFGYITLTVDGKTYYSEVIHKGCDENKMYLEWRNSCTKFRTIYQQLNNPTLFFLNRLVISDSIDRVEPRLTNTQSENGWGEQLIISSLLKNTFRIRQEITEDMMQALKLIQNHDDINMYDPANSVDGQSVEVLDLIFESIESPGKYVMDMVFSSQTMYSGTCCSNETPNAPSVPIVIQPMVYRVAILPAPGSTELSNLIAGGTGIGLYVYSITISAPGHSGSMLPNRNWSYSRPGNVLFTSISGNYVARDAFGNSASQTITLLQGGIFDDITITGVAPGMIYESNNVDTIYDKITQPVDIQNCSIISPTSIFPFIVNDVNNDGQAKLTIYQDGNYKYDGTTPPNRPANVPFAYDEFEVMISGCINDTMMLRFYF